MQDMGIQIKRKAPQYVVCFCGDLATGKTTLVKACMGIHGDKIYQPTIVADHSTYKIKLDSGEEKAITFWDLVGSENYRVCAPQFFREAMLNVVLFDITQPATFEGVQWWVNLASSSTGRADVPFILVGNKCDLEDARAVQTSDGEDLAKRINALAYIETSATEMVQIEDVRGLIEQQAKEFFEKHRDVDEPEPIKLDDPTPAPTQEKQCSC